MKILHPDHKIAKPLSQLTEYLDEGVYSIISAEEKEKLKYFLKCFEEYRKEKNEKISDTTLYNNLPFSINTPSWKAKQKDVKIIERLIARRKNLKILDIGCWNGWLCNYLTEKGHRVVGVDVFTDELDGLKAKKHYTNNFILFQLIPEEIFRIQSKFDLIIFNRNWAYISDQQTIFNHTKNMLLKNGIILFTGLTFYRNPKKIIQHLAKTNKYIKNKYDISILYKPSKGYLDKTDFFFFKKNCIELVNNNEFKNKFNFIVKKLNLFHSVYGKFTY